MSDWRGIDRIVNTGDFERAWAMATEAQRSKLIALFQDGLKDQVISWYRGMLKEKTLDGKSVKELRSMAKSALVPKYGELSKDQLVAALKELGKDEGTSDDDPASRGTDAPPGRGVAQASPGHP